MTKDQIVQGLNRISELKNALPLFDRQLIKEAADILDGKAHLMNLNDLCGAFNHEDAVWLEHPICFEPRFIVVQIAEIDIPDDRSHIDNIKFSNGFTEELLSIGRTWRCWNIKPDIVQRLCEPWVSQRTECEKAIEQYLSYRKEINFNNERRWKEHENYFRRLHDRGKALGRGGFREGAADDGQRRNEENDPEPVGRISRGI